MVFLLVLLWGCSEGALKPVDGPWHGDVIEFEVEGSKILWVEMPGVQCIGTNDAGDNCGVAFQSERMQGPFKVKNAQFSATLISNNLYQLEIVEGRFLSPYEAEGTYRLEAFGCCVKTGAFVASSEERPPVVQDTGGSSDTGSQPDTTTPVDTGNPPPDIVTTPQDCGEPMVPLTFGGCTPPATNADQKAALSEVNKIRGWLKVPLINGHTSLNQSSQAHCECYVTHYDAVYAAGMSGHQEDTSYEGCYGVDFWDRMAHFGYDKPASFEIMSFQADPVAAVHGWTHTLYHRLPIVDPYTLEGGYGGAADGWVMCDTMNFGSGNVAGSDAIAILPFDGQVGVATAWDGNELPQPQPPDDGYPSGPIITVTTGPDLNLKVDTYSLRHEDGTEVPVIFLDEAVDGWLVRTTALYAHSPLDPVTTYTVSLSGELNGSSWNKTWSFTTGLADYYWDYNIPAP
ncbi:MAG: hypothetical protein CMH54_02460 [Myxococcales bacterium]|nr:hypothetical protein [Myxococcales bacterium]